MKREGCYDNRGSSEEVEERLSSIAEIREESWTLCFPLHECYDREHRAYDNKE